MSQLPEKYTRRRLRSSYFSVVVSIALVLFVLGIFGLLVLNANSIANQVREDFTILVLLNDDAPETEVRQFQKSLQLEPFTKDLEYISKEEAAAELQSDLGEDFIEFAGGNPLLDALELRLKAEFVTEERISELEGEFSKNSFVNEVVYDEPLIQMMNKNIERIGIFLMAGTVLLALIAIGLINSSIRLSIYSRRFLIKTMQLVGATKSFIRRPFIWRSFRHGVFGALLASVFLAGVLVLIARQIPGLAGYQNIKMLAALLGGLVLTGIAISMACTFFALKKYLKLTTDQLYY